MKKIFLFILIACGVLAGVYYLVPEIFPDMKENIGDKLDHVIAVEKDSSIINLIYGES